MQSTATIILMRHAQAVDPPPGSDDFARALTAQGLQDAQQMGQWLYGVIPTLELMVSSPALRAQQTTKAVVAAWPAPPRIVLESTLYLGELDALVATLAWASPGPCAVVAHNPGLETLLAWLSPAAAVGHGAMRPASACVVDLVLVEGVITAGSGKLRCAMSPMSLARV
jgi:phosphohistidine phosphatase